MDVTPIIYGRGAGERISGIAELTDESVCPTLVRGRCRVRLDLRKGCILFGLASKMGSFGKSPLIAGEGGPGQRAAWARLTTSCLLETGLVVRDMVLPL